MLRFSTLLIALTLLTSVGLTYYQGENSTATEQKTGNSMSEAAGKFLQSLDQGQRSQAQLPYDTPKRFDWHFIPKSERKGLQIKHMNPQQRDAAHALLKSALSASGYEKVTGIMELEKLLYELEGGRGQNIRDSERYYYSVFGDPEGDGQWGLSVEGHHLSLNFVVNGPEVVSSTPLALCTNPAVVMTENQSGIPVGTRLIEEEETLAFELINSLDETQKKIAMISEDALSEVREPGSQHPPQDDPVGIEFNQLNTDQQTLLMDLLKEYCATLPEQVGEARLDEITEAGVEEVHFAWAGATEPGIGHYYRVQGPTFLVEFVNTQPDAAGNPANHIHCVWRDMRGDFATAVGE